MLDVEAFLKARQWIQWKTVIIVTVSFTIVHFLLQQTFITQENFILSQDETPRTGDSVGDLVTQFPEDDFTDWGGEAPLDSIPSPTHAVVETPTVEIPKVERPIVKIPIVETPKVEIPTVKTTPPPPRPEPTLPNVPTSEHIAICISVANQSLEMQEWLVHHYYHMNISHFYIMDDGSLPPLSTFSYPGVPRSALTFTYQPRETRDGFQQLAFYSTCLQNWNRRHHWMAFLDADEFLDTPGNETLAQVLESFEDDEEVGALGVNWRIHTSSGHLTRQNSSREAFTSCMYDGPGTHNRHVKSIVKTSHAESAINPHKFNLRPGTYTAGEHGDHIDTEAFREPITRDRVGLHHYVVKSREEFVEKMLRGNGMTQPKDEGLWEEFEFKVPHVPCTEMVGYRP